MGIHMAPPTAVMGAPTVMMGATPMMMPQPILM
jgi:hypothetical protein